MDLLQIMTGNHAPDISFMLVWVSAWWSGLPDTRPWEVQMFF